MFYSIYSFITNHFQIFNCISNNNAITIKINNYISIWINLSIINKNKLLIFNLYHYIKQNKNSTIKLRKVFILMLRYYLIEKSIIDSIASSMFPWQVSFPESLISKQIIGLSILPQRNLDQINWMIYRKMPEVDSITPCYNLSPSLYAH